jgi:hypothetical protein
MSLLPIGTYLVGPGCRKLRQTCKITRLGLPEATYPRNCGFLINVFLPWLWYTLAIVVVILWHSATTYLNQTKCLRILSCNFDKNKCSKIQTCGPGNGKCLRCRLAPTLGVQIVGNDVKLTQSQDQGYRNNLP